MPRRRGNQRKVVSLADFNSEYVQDDKTALPSAPKTEEQWEQEGGRPTYYRGSKQRRHHINNDSGNLQKGPVDGNLNNGKERPEREMDWGSARAGGINAVYQDTPGREERNWNSMNRRPVQQDFGSRRRENNWSSKRGPMKAANAPRERDWKSSRGFASAEARAPPQTQREWNDTRQKHNDSRFDESEPQRSWRSGRVAANENNSLRGRNSGDFRANDPTYQEEYNAPIEEEEDWDEMRARDYPKHFREQEESAPPGGPFESESHAAYVYPGSTRHPQDDKDYIPGENGADQHGQNYEYSEQGIPSQQNESFRRGPVVGDGTRRTKNWTSVAEEDQGEENAPGENRNGDGI